MAAFWKGPESARVFQVPFPLGTFYLYPERLGFVPLFLMFLFKLGNMNAEITQNLGIQRNPNQSGKADSKIRNF